MKIVLMHVARNEQGDVLYAHDSKEEVEENLPLLEAMQGKCVIEEATLQCDNGKMFLDEQARRGAVQ